MSVPTEGHAWLLNEFIDRVAGAAHAIVVTADGLVMANSKGLDKDHADQLAAVVSGVVSLSIGAARCFDAGEVTQNMIAMRRGFLMIVSIGEGSSLAVLASPSTDLGVLGYEMEVQASQFRDQLTAQPRQSASAHAAG